MAVLLEIVVEIALQFLFEVLVERGTRGAGRLLDDGRARTITVWSITVAIAVVGGAWWGAYVADQGRQALPDSVWASLVLAAVTGAMAIRTKSRSVGGTPEPAPRGGRLTGPFTAERWALLSAMSACAAAGISVGFSVSR